MILTAATVLTWASLSLMPVPPVVEANVGSCPEIPEAFGCAYRTSMWIKDVDDDRQNRRTTFHELGHLFDQQVMTYRARMVFRLLVRDERKWRVSNEPDSPNERFAEAYASCAMSARGPWYVYLPENPDDYEAYYDFQSNKRVRRAICNLIEATAKGRV